MEIKKSFSLGKVLGFSAVHTGETQTAQIEVLSINVRNSLANDGENSWANRRDGMMDIVRARSYDFIGGQEVIINQNDETNQFKFMCEKLPEYGVLYRSREVNEN